MSMRVVEAHVEAQNLSPLIALDRRDFVTVNIQVTATDSLELIQPRSIKEEGSYESCNVRVTALLYPIPLNYKRDVCKACSYTS